jgi:hypothetical protein
VQETIFRSSWDTALVATPLFLLLVAGIFRLDERAARRSPKPSQPAICGKDDDGAPILTDPDGRPWETPGSRE